MSLRRSRNLILIILVRIQGVTHRFQIIKIVWCSGYENSRNRSHIMIFIDLLNLDAELDSARD
jgi:hypothetical protein